MKLAHSGGMETQIASQTRHSWNCTKAWKNYDMSCPRCQELAGGAKARTGWGASRQQQDALRCVQIKRHFNEVGADGLTGHQRNERTNGVDTAFEW